MAMEEREKDFWPYPSILLAGELTDETSADLLWWLGYWQDHNPHRRLSVFIDSNGGALFAATAVAEAFRVSPNPIATVTIGRSYSGAALITASGDRGQQITNTETTSIVEKERDTIWERILNTRNIWMPKRL